MNNVIKCLSVRPPYADWIVNPQKFIDAHIMPKCVENREWETSYRGQLLIHSSNTFESDAIDHWMYHRCPQMRGVWSEDKKDYHRGMIVGIADLVDCVTRMDSPWFVGTYGFVLANAKPFKTPIPYKGALGLFNVPMSVVEREIWRLN